MMSPRRWADVLELRTDVCIRFGHLEAWAEKCP